VRVVEAFSQQISRANCPTIVFVPSALLQQDTLVRHTWPVSCAEKEGSVAAGPA
jgi:hypothetical protein